MKRFALLSILACGLSLLQQGCTIHWVVKNPVPLTPTPVPTAIPYPNAWNIEVRVKGQIDRLKLSMKNGTLDQETAYFLGQNDELIRQFSNEDRTPNQTVDLTYQQKGDLDSMLDDNSYFIDDAIQHHQAWVQYFQTENYDYTSSASPYLYLTYLDHQLRAQQGMIDSAQKDGRLTDTQAQELSNRVKVIKTAKRNYYRENAHVDLSEDQVRQLSQMAQDNSQFLRFRLKGSHGRWNKDKFTSWTKQNHLGFGHDNGNHWGRRDNLPNPVPTATKPTVVASIPTPVPTTARTKPTVVVAIPTPVPTKPALVPTHIPTAIPVVATHAPTKPAVATAVPTAKPHVTVPPALKLLPPGQLVQFLQHADQSVQTGIKAGRLNDSQTTELNQKLQALHQKADDDLKQNQAKSVTQEQMVELSKMLAEINKTVQNSIQHNRTKPGGAFPNRSNNSKKDDKDKTKTEDKKTDVPAADNSKKDIEDKKDKAEKKDGDAASSDKKADTPAADNADAVKKNDKDQSPNGDKKDSEDKKDNGKGNDQR